MDTKEYYIERNKMKIHLKLQMPSDHLRRCPLVIIAHGLTGHMEEPHIRKIADAMAENGYAALRIDLYGHGKSDGEFRDHTMLDWELDLLTVIDHVKKMDFISAIYLAGHSQGGAATVLTAGMKSDDLTAIILLAPGMTIKDYSIKGKLLDASFDPQHIPDTLTIFGEHPISGNYFRVNQLLPLEEAVKRYDRPVLIMQSDTDELVPHSYAEKLAAMYKNASLEVIHGDNHVFEKHIDLVTDAMLKFLLSCNPNTSVIS